MGQTCREIRIRCQRANYHKGTIIRDIFDKYENEDFVCVILEDALTKEEADEREKYWISLLNTTDPRFGYNVTFGGSGVLGIHPTRSIETRKKMSASRMGEKNPMYGKHHSEEHKQHLSQVCRNNPKQHLKGVKAFTKDGQFYAEYPSEWEASRGTGVKQNSISACCLGRTKSAGEYIFQFSN